MKVVVGLGLCRLCDNKSKTGTWFVSANPDEAPDFLCGECDPHSMKQAKSQAQRSVKH